MAIWYVDSLSGLDTNDGLSMGTAFATISHAHDQTNPGDTVYILPGKGYGGGTTGDILDFSRSGSAAGGYITYSGYPGVDMPILNGSSSGNGQCFLLQAPLSYIRITNIEFAGI